MVQLVILVLGSNLKIGYSDCDNVIVHGNIDKIKLLDGSGGVTTRELFPDNKINIIFHGSSLSIQHVNESIVVLSGYFEGYAIVSVDGEEIAKYELKPNGVYVSRADVED